MLCRHVQHRLPCEGKRTTSSIQKAAIPGQTWMPLPIIPMTSLPLSSRYTSSFSTFVNSPTTIRVFYENPSRCRIVQRPRDVCTAIRAPFELNAAVVRIRVRHWAIIDNSFVYTVLATTMSGCQGAMTRQILREMDDNIGRQKVAYSCR